MTGQDRPGQNRPNGVRGGRDRSGRQDITRASAESRPGSRAALPSNYHILPKGLLMTSVVTVLCVVTDAISVRIPEQSALWENSRKFTI